MHRVLVVAGLLVAFTVVVAPPSAAKEGAQARLVTPIPRDAEPGTTVTVVWTLSVVDRKVRRPFSAEPVYIRLFGPSGRPSPRAYAVQPRPGRYRARVAVPPGGVGRVVIALMGSSCDASGCRPSPLVFRIVGPVFG